jgi:hypothetical protein
MWLALHPRIANIGLNPENCIGTHAGEDGKGK